MSKSKTAENPIFKIEEIKEMFDTSFLPKLQQFAKRAEEINHPEEEMAYFQVRMQLKFSDLSAPLTYESIKDDLEMQLLPVTKDALAQQEAKKKEKEKENKDCGDCA